MHIMVKAAMVGMLASGGSVFAVGNAAWAIAYCERLTGPPQFSGSQISGFYAVICDRKVGSNTLYAASRRTGRPFRTRCTTRSRSPSRTPTKIP
jgi:hypothetical protein